MNPPLRPFRCLNGDCGFPHGGRCAREAEFADPAASCVELMRGEAPAAPAEIPAPKAEDLLPWSGQHFTTREGLALTRRGKTACIALIGPAGSGKTSLIASLFLQIANGRRPGLPLRFAGSRSLPALDRLIQKAAAWGGSAEQQIVDHTPVSAEPDPGTFLHLSLRPEEDRDAPVLEVLLSDVAGEHFAEWALESNEKTTTRLPFLPLCQEVMVLVDAHALQGEEGGTLDMDTAMVIRRLVQESRSWPRRPHLSLVYTKLDQILPREEIVLDAQLWKRLEDDSWRSVQAMLEARDDGMNAEVTGVAAFPCALAKGQPAGVTELFGAAITRINKQRPWARLELPVPAGGPSFLCVRRERP